jgi:hypothetical protein
MVFAGLGWRVIEIDGHDHDRIRAALAEAKTAAGQPTLIIGHTPIAKRSCSMENSCDSHGSPFSEDEIKKTKECLGLPADTPFFLPREVLDHFRVRYPALRQARRDWLDTLSGRLDTDPAFESLWRQIRRTPANRTFVWPEFEAGSSVATRKAWGAALAARIDQKPLFGGGSADLDPTNQTAKFRDTTGIFDADNPAGRTLCFGVREFPMGAILNGIALHGGLVPFGATFLVFSDYERNALRMSACALPVITSHPRFLFVGEDGPTHQPIEHASSLRLIPNMLVMRPADARETCLCVDTALKQKNRPTCLLLTRQGLPVLDAARFPGLAEGVARGGYILAEARAGPGRHPSGLGLRGLPGPGGRGTLARIPVAGGQHAVHGAFRRAAQGLPRGRPAAPGDQAVRRGGRTSGTVVQIYRQPGPGAGHQPFRGLGPGQTSGRRIRIHPRTPGHPGAPGVFRQGVAALEAPDRKIGLDLVRVTEAAALSCSRWLGTGDKIAGDQAAVDAMRLSFNTVPLDGIIVIGEGEKDEAPMLFNGEKVGMGLGQAVDVAVDPWRGPTSWPTAVPTPSPWWAWPRAAACSIRGPAIT